MLSVRPFAKHELGDACDFLFETFAEDPAFHELYAFESPSEVETARPVFESMCDGDLADSVLGCYRDDRLVGVAKFSPHFPDPWFRLTQPLQSLQIALAVLRGKWRYRLRGMNANSRARWKLYGVISKRQAPIVRRIHVLAIAVPAAERGKGVARTLLRAVERAEPWAAQCSHLEVNTWHPTKIEIFERLGFECYAHASIDGVTCWTGLRPIDETPGEDSAAQGGEARNPEQRHG